MPAWATLWSGSPSRSLPRKRMTPSRRRRMPMIARRVVVLPAPLRPSSVTVSPSRMSRSTPCRTWLSPYQALSPRTSRRGALLMLGSHIGFAHPRILADGIVGPVGEDLAAGQNGDAVAEIGDDVQVVLDHEHGTVAGDAPDQVGNATDILVAHAGHRLVEQQHGRV